jgi:uncharacterized protein (TIGR04255 family)
MLPVPADRPADLPDFESPPVTEVVLSIQFGQLPGFRTVHAGLLWSELRAQYPRVSEQPPVSPVYETFGSPAAPGFHGIQFEQLLGVPALRVWFEEENGEHLLQIQPDRLICNWRKQKSSSTYPRYEVLRERFLLNTEFVKQFLEREQLGQITPNQCEVTYINTIQIPDVKDPHQRLKDVTPLWSGRPTSRTLPRCENAGIQARYVLSMAGKPYGRLYVNFTPGVLAPENTPVIRLELTARGKPSGNTIEDAFALLDEERRVIVEGFAAVTTTKMHKIWGRKDG